MDFLLSGFGPDPNPVVILLISVWTLFWKGIALWRSAQAKQKYWFIVILLLNIFGIVEIVYLFKFAKKPLTISEMRSWIGK